MFTARSKSNHLRVLGLPARTWFALFLGGGVWSACVSQDYNPLKMQMQSLYRPAYELFTLVWNPKQFSDPKERDHVLALLKTLTKDFHKVGRVADSKTQDPGVQATLLVTQRLLNDAENRFASGDTDYARWRLKGLVSSCVSCHTRKEQDQPFYGAAPVAEPSNFESAVNVADFLIASRQFEEAGEHLFHLAKRAAEEGDLHAHLLPLLRKWLLIQVRVMQGNSKAAPELRELADSPSVTPEEKKLFRHWADDLQKLQGIVAQGPAVTVAEELLAPVRNNSLLANDEQNLVETLRASALLHDFLDTPQPKPENRPKATLLLAVSYQHMNILSFIPMRDLYLERTIRAYPGTEEAREAFKIYQANLQSESSGSGGTHIDEADKKRLEELRALSESVRL